MPPPVPVMMQAFPESLFDMLLLFDCRRRLLTHFQDDDLIAGWIGRLAEVGDLRRRDRRRLVASPIADEGDNVGDLLIGILLAELRHAIRIRRALDDQRI